MRDLGSWRQIQQYPKINSEDALKELGPHWLHLGMSCHGDVSKYVD